MSLLSRLRLGLAVGIAKTVTSLVRFFKLGAASVMPGEIALRIQPKLLAQLCDQVKEGVILIVGTNGKTTTSLLLRTLIESQGYKVVHNETGANLVNGLATALLGNSNLLGSLKADYAILEVDENILPIILRSCEPRYILALNLFRDQLDRYGEVDTISHRWQKAIAPLSQNTTVVLNCDDPTLCYLGQNLEQKVLFFGLSEPKFYLNEIPHAVDSIYCPNCGASLEYEGVYLSHLGEYTCPSCDFTKSKPNINSQDWPQILIGVYNKYNTLAAGLLAQEIGIETEQIHNIVKDFKAAFGRAEELKVQGKQVRILLSKNPVGMNETIRAVNEVKEAGKASTTLMVLNDRIPDGTDVSWIWDVDTEQLVSLGGNIVVSGDRVYDMALRIKYSQEKLEQEGNNLQIFPEENLATAIDKALELTAQSETLHIVPTYSAMLEVRKLLTGKKIL